MNKTSNLLKPYLRKFILQIHPDFFHHNSLRKQINASSLQKLYSILQPERETKRNSETIKLKFYSKHQRKHNSELPIAAGTFNSCDSEWVKADTFFNLCKQLNIPIVQSDLDVIQDMKTKEQYKNVKSKPYKSLTKEFAEKLHKEYSTPTNNIWKPEDILNQKMIMFDPLVDQTSLANKLSHWLPQLQPDKWWGKIPVLIISPNSEIPPKELCHDLLILKSDMILKGKRSKQPLIT
ncbi:MAG: hypothetical protein EXX96DRAFT_42863 [Benjaminiella poitrasii]|nr:MAG: hypothetical protein EXX96DRAFT_42863 [Benjaminiella poitrasii]